MKSILIALAMLAIGAGAALAQEDTCAPAKVSDLHQDLTGYHSYTIEWTNTGDDCTTGDAYTYELWRKTGSLNDTNWQSGTKIDYGTAGTNGTETCFSATVSCPGGSYYYCVFLIDENGNRSPISNVIFAGPRCGTPYNEVECYE